MSTSLLETIARLSAYKSMESSQVTPTMDVGHESSYVKVGSIEL